MKTSQILRTTVPLLVACLSFSACRTVQQVLPDHPRQAPRVSMQDVTFFSNALHRPMPYRVYLPARLVPNQKLPVVYLLHGNGGSFRNWSNYSDVALYAASGYILVMPEGESSYYTNAALKPADRYEDYFFVDLLHDVEARFPAAADRQHRAVIGVSMGGFAAVKFALARPDLFAFAGAISPALDVPSRAFSLRRFSQSQRFRTIFGPTGSATRKASDPFILVQSANPTATPYLYITAGDNEPLLDPIRRFANRLGMHHFNYEFHTKPGVHDWNQWDAQIPGCFQALLQRIPTPVTRPQ